MPQIKQYTRKVLPNELVNVQASAASFGGDVSGLQAQAQSQQQMANALGELEAGVNTIIKKREESDYITRYTDLRLKADQLKRDLRTQDFEDDAQVSEAYQARLEELTADFKVPRSMQDRWTVDSSNMKMDFARTGAADQAERVGMRAKINFENTQTNITNAITMGEMSEQEGVALLSQQIDALPNTIGVEKDALKESIKDSIRGVVAKNESTNNPYNFVKEAKAGKYKDVPDLAQYVQRAKSEIKKNTAKQVAEQKRVVHDEYKNFVNYTNSGIVYSREKAEQLAKSAEATGQNDVAKDIRLRATVQDGVSEFIRNTPLNEQQSVLENKAKLASGDLSEEALFELKAYQKAFQFKASEIQSGRGADYYTEIGVIDAPPTWDISNPEGFALGYAQRRNNQRTIAEREGVLIPIITKKEADGFSDYYKSLSASEQVNYISGLSQVADGSDLKDMAKMVAGNDKNLATALALIKDSPAQARDIITGSKRSKVVPKQEILDTLTPSYGAAIQDPIAFNQITDAVHNLAEEKMFRDGATVSTPDYIEEAAKEILGEPITYGSTSILPFKKENGEFITEGEFKRINNQITPTLLNAKMGDSVFVNGKPATKEWIQEALDSWQLVTVGDGEYMLQNGSDVVVGSDGAPFIFDYKKIYKDVDTRGFVAKGWDSISGSFSSFTSPLE